MPRDKKLDSEAEAVQTVPLNSNWRGQAIESVMSRMMAGRTRPSEGVKSDEPDPKPTKSK